MDFERAAHIINMDLTGSDPGPLPVPNGPDEFVYEHDELGRVFAEPADAWNETTDTQRTFTIEILFDAPTDLEASLATAAVAGFVRRRLGLDNAVIIGRSDF